ncbi:Uncharacterised protein [Mycobacterium tuberculosis]|nr:Uncharacterised protein [Mycobacterium tuberculosis]COZ90499.1 Uncharacterised protein [Mycobacterium tuberculosis]
MRVTSTSGGLTPGARATSKTLYVLAPVALPSTRLPQ